MKLRQASRLLLGTKSAPARNQIPPQRFEHGHITGPRKHEPHEGTGALPSTAPPETARTKQMAANETVIRLRMQSQLDLSLLILRAETTLPAPDWSWCLGYTQGVSSTMAALGFHHGEETMRFLFHLLIQREKP